MGRLARKLLDPVSCGPGTCLKSAGNGIGWPVDMPGSRRERDRGVRIYTSEIRRRS